MNYKYNTLFTGVVVFGAIVGFIFLSSKFALASSSDEYSYRPSDAYSFVGDNRRREGSGDGGNYHPDYSFSNRPSDAYQFLGDDSRRNDDYNNRGENQPGRDVNYNQDNSYQYRGNDNVNQKDNNNHQNNSGRNNEGFSSGGGNHRRNYSMNNIGHSYYFNDYEPYYTASYYAPYYYDNYGYGGYNGYW